MKLIEKGFLERNKKYLLISFLLFIIPAILAAILTYFTMGNDYGSISNQLYYYAENGLGGPSPISSPGGFELFIHNLMTECYIVLGGLLFSVISVLLVIYNGYLIGYPFGTDLLFASLSILPHSVIEYPALILALAAAFNITSLEIKMIKSRSFKTVLDENRIVLKDILSMIIIMVILLAIAAFIEGNLTVPIINWFYGL